MNYSETELESYLRTGENEAELRQEFGDLLYEDLARMAVQLGAMSKSLERSRRKVYILPGFLGSRLSAVRNGVQDLVWIDPLDIVGGGLRKLWPSKEDTVIAATGPVLAPYARMLFRLKLAGFDAAYLPYDWRLSPQESGAALMAKLQSRGDGDVALIGHSMGGMVARAMAAADPTSKTISRVITVGTPNHGSYAPVEVMALTHSAFRAVAAIDVTQDAREIATGILRHFPGLLQLLPDPDKRQGENYYLNSAWPKDAVKPLKEALDLAGKGQSSLPLPDNRFTEIVGWSEETVVGARKKGNSFEFDLRRDGDGTVPRDLAESKGTTRYYTRGLHGALCVRGDVIASTIDLIGTGHTTRLPQTLPIQDLESLPKVAIGASELAERNAGAVSRAPKRTTDFAGAFLSVDMLDDGSQDLSSFESRVSAFDREVGNYPLNVMSQARSRWEETRAEREDVIDKMRNHRPLETETPARLKAYTERLLSHVKSQPHSDPRIIESLETAARKSAAGVDAVSMPAADRAFLERVIGEAEEFLSVVFVKRAVVAAASVGRIVTRDRHRGFGTGFMIAPGVLMTNEHVLRSAMDAHRASVQFGYELEIDGKEMPGRVFTLEPERLFYSNRELDMAIVAVAPTALDGSSLTRQGYVPLIGAEGKIRKGQPVNIVQHPLGNRKQIVFRESELSALPVNNDHVAHYTGDTHPGSSGSAVFNDFWEVIALHHSGVPDQNPAGQYLSKDGEPWDRFADPAGKTIKWVSNEGIRISRIVRHLLSLPDQLEAAGQPGADLVRSVLRVSSAANANGVFHQGTTETFRHDEARTTESAGDEQLRIANPPLSPTEGMVGQAIVPLQLNIAILTKDDKTRIV